MSTTTKTHYEIRRNDGVSKAVHYDTFDAANKEMHRMIYASLATCYPEKFEWWDIVEVTTIERTIPYTQDTAPMTQQISLCDNCEKPVNYCTCWDDMIDEYIRDRTNKECTCWDTDVNPFDNNCPIHPNHTLS